MRKLFLLFLLTVSFFITFAQPVYKDATENKRRQLYNHLIKNTIDKNLSVDLTDSTEEQWQDAFYALELIGRKNLWVDKKIWNAVQEIESRSVLFQRALLELIYTNYPNSFYNKVKALMQVTSNEKIFALCGEYLLLTDTATDKRLSLIFLVEKRIAEFTGPWITQLLFNIYDTSKLYKAPSVHTLLERSYLPGNVLMISLQRKNRDYPGLVLVRDTAGNFVIDSAGIFSVPQLARSLSNLPGYLTNGNTPEGILRMDGFDVSRIGMIGPTINIQLSLPYELAASHFYNDSLAIDSLVDIETYKSLLPHNFRNHFPLYQTYYAGLAGRSEIIAHGTTIDPEWYANEPYYPLTPTIGCLTSKEIWSKEDGRRLVSDQQTLVDEIKIAGGAKGYAIVINIDNKNEPVTLKDILPFLKLAGQIN